MRVFDILEVHQKMWLMKILKSYQLNYKKITQLENELSKKSQIYDVALEKISALKKDNRSKIASDLNSKY